MLVFTHVSSMNTNREASIRDWIFRHQWRLRAMSGLVASSACRLFFEAEAKPVNGSLNRSIANRNTTQRQFSLKPAQAHMAFGRNPLSYPALMRLQYTAAVPANFADRNIARLAQLVSPTHRRGTANGKCLGGLARAVLQTITRRSPTQIKGIIWELYMKMTYPDTSLNMSRGVMPNAWLLLPILALTNS